VAKNVTEPSFRRPSLAASWLEWLLVATLMKILSWAAGCNREDAICASQFSVCVTSSRYPHFYTLPYPSPAFTILIANHSPTIPIYRPRAPYSDSTSVGVPRFPDRPLTCAPTLGTRFQQPALAFYPYRHFHKQNLAPLHPSTTHHTPHRPPNPISLTNTDSYHRSPSPHCARQLDKSHTNHT
jgi:hypothetical protein